MKPNSTAATLSDFLNEFWIICYRLLNLMDYFCCNFVCLYFVRRADFTKESALDFRKKKNLDILTVKQ